MVIGRAALTTSTVDTTSAAMGATVDATGAVPEDGVEVPEGGGEVSEGGGEPTELMGVASGVAPAPFETELAPMEPWSHWRRTRTWLRPRSNCPSRRLTPRWAPGKVSKLGRTW
jgi:hypothetical protein